MKLLVATPLYPPEIGGPATYVRQLEEGLPSLGITVEVVKFADVRNLPKLFRHHAYYKKLLEKARDVDAILALDPVSVGLPASEAAKKLKKPFFVKIVGDYAWEQGVQRFGVTASLDEFVTQKNVPLPVSFLRFTEKKVAERAVRVIVPSTYLKGVVSAWGINPDRITVVHNAVSLPALSSSEMYVQHFSRPRIVSIGRLVPWKGMDGVIDAVAALNERGGSASLAIVGEGEEKVRLEVEARKKLPGLHVFTGRLSHEKTLAILKDADVFVLNSRYEGLSHLLIEATLLHVPIVATDAGGNKEVVEHEQNGLLVPPGDQNALTEAIARIVTDASFAEKLRRGAQVVAKRFASERMYQETVNVLSIRA